MAMPSSFGHFKSIASRLLQYVALAVGLVAMVAITVPSLNAMSRTWLAVTLWCCLGFFAGEFAIKSWPSAGAKTVSNYPLTSSGVIDLLAVLPVPLALLIGVPADTAWLLASLWLLKLTPVVPGLAMLGRVIEQEARPLASVFVIFLIVLVLSAVALYVLERAGQPERFGSLPQALWWAVTTLTTTGYGDAVPETFLGRMIAGMVMICGLGVFGLWTGILATGFAAEHRRRDFIQNWDLVTSVPFLRNLDAPAIIELTHKLRRLDLAERIVVVRRGRPGDCMYFIASGEVEVRDRATTDPPRRGLVLRRIRAARRRSAHGDRGNDDALDLVDLGSFRLSRFHRASSGACKGGRARSCSPQGHKQGRASGGSTTCAADSGRPRRRMTPR